VAVAAALLGAPAARAATYLFNFADTGGDLGALNFSVIGTTVTAVSGTMNGFAVTGLSTYAGADQQFFAAGPVHFTVPGVSFATSNGVLYNLTAYPNNADALTNSVTDPNGTGAGAMPALTSVSVAAVPLPSSGLLLLIGIGGLATLRRVRRTVAVALAVLA
jgi:hypothetical protein